MLPMGKSSNARPASLDEGAKQHDQASMDDATDVSQDDGAGHDHEGLEYTPQELSTAARTLSRRASVQDPFNTKDPNWTLERALAKTIQLARNDGLPPVILENSVRFVDVQVFGEGVDVATQPDCTSIFTAPFKSLAGLFKRPPERQILHGIHGLVREGEMLLLLGRPGAGCTTLLKTLCGHTEGFTRCYGDITYHGVPIETMKSRFRGKVVYNADGDCHFPHLTVAQTLDFALSTSTPRQRAAGLSRGQYIVKMRNILAATVGLTHTLNTKVGNDYIRGVSGGERKRVSIAEMMATRASVMYWDNPTRGLDSSTSLEFVRSLRVATNLTRNVSVAALYQPGDGLVDVFDKGLVMYNGHQIWFGDLQAGKRFFEEMGFYCSPRVTTAEFLTSITDSAARRIRRGFEDQVPQTPEEFAARWKESVHYRRLTTEIQEHARLFPRERPESVVALHQHQMAEKAPLTRKESPYMLNLWMQFAVTSRRAMQRITQDAVYTVAMAFTMVSMALIVGSMFYDIPEDTSGFFSKGGLIFFSVLFNIIINFAEVSAQFSQRPIVEKHKSFAMYHPFIDALATMMTQWPLKLANVAIFSVIIYFLANFKREAGPFFLFTLFNFLISVTMSGFFRTVATLVDTVEAGLGFAGLLMLPLAVYAGYVIPRPSMHPWFKWISYMNPIYYAIEAQMVVEFHGRQAPCTASMVPSGPGFENVGLDHQVCAVTGAKAGRPYVLGDDYIEASFAYSYSHLWRNLGICLAFFVFFVFTYAIAAEYKQMATSKGEFLIFRRPVLPFARQSSKTRSGDVQQTLNRYLGETVEPDTVEKSEDVFTWNHINYDVSIKGETRRLLDDVKGFVKPGTLTALMGESGAGKTTLLNVLAQRITTGVVSGEVLVNGFPLDQSFQRRTGYVQQQDIHLAEATVREALRFSALLRQPACVTVEEKYEHVEKIITALGMQKYADAVIGVPGQGLNVEQRKRTTIGLELVAKPSLLLFLDEPTSGLDSQSAWAIIKLLRDLADAGQAILCTIHQPSAALFEQFDRIFLLAKGGKTVYFGDLGADSKTLRDYFERNGARRCEDHENPAEYILDVIGGSAASKEGAQKWADAWLNSPEYNSVMAEIQQLEQAGSAAAPDEEHGSFALPIHEQYLAVQKRLFQQYWRSPFYIQAKLATYVVGGLFLGFTFWKEKTSVQGLQNKVFAIYMMLLVCLVVVVQLQPRLIAFRELYDVRERHSKMYHWTVFVLASFVVEVPVNVVIASLSFVAWYFPVGWRTTVSDGRGAAMWLIFTVYQLYHSSFSQAIAMVAPNAETAAMLTILFYTFILAFSGVVQPLAQFVGFWRFAYYVSPFTWLVSALMATGVHDVPVRCAAVEVNVFQPPDGMTCGQYAGAFAAAAAGAIYNPQATSDCQYCRYAVADVFLHAYNMVWEDRWRNLGYLWAYTAFNVCAFFAAYWLHSAVGFANLAGRVKRLLLVRWT
ncbi:ABC transporter-like protein [Macrophomina phaseolina MS6]|uniref:ABC transporter-like protein n=1 Tax=Macrophomina phaseolina (strain MS6) TaxID=1126212 RepID=K2SBT0_MACPH|nr:ABC transporter-like protein [Macrophomina phaseolina MS6]